MKPTTERPYLMLFASLALVGLLADQVSKYAIFTHLYDEHIGAPHVVVIPNLFHLRVSHVHYKLDAEGQPITFLVRDPGDQPLSFLRTISGECLPTVNRGALFGIGNADSDDSGWNIPFAVVSVLAALFIVWWASRPAVASDRFLSIALGLILAGTLGNLYDRVVFSGVRDFLHCFYDTHVWPDFNVADCCLVCGAGVLMVHSFFVTEPATPSVVPETATAGASAPSAAPTNGA